PLDLEDADALAGERRARGRDQVRRDVHGGSGEKSGRRLRLVQQRLHLGLQRRVTGARRAEGRRALVRGTREHLVIQRLDASPPIGRHTAATVSALMTSPLIRRAFFVPRGPATPAAATPSRASSRASPCPPTPSRQKRSPRR